MEKVTDLNIPTANGTIVNCYGSLFKVKDGVHVYYHHYNHDNGKVYLKAIVHFEDKGLVNSPKLLSFLNPLLTKSNGESLVDEEDAKYLKELEDGILLDNAEESNPRFEALNRNIHVAKASPLLTA